MSSEEESEEGDRVSFNSIPVLSFIIYVISCYAMLMCCTLRGRACFVARSDLS